MIFPLSSPGFETQGEWTYALLAERVTTFANSGLFSVYLPTRGGIPSGAYAMITSESLSVIQGQQMTCTFYYYATEGQPGFGIEFYVSHDGGFFTKVWDIDYWYDVFTQGLANQWNKVSVTFTAMGTSFRIRFKSTEYYDPFSVWSTNFWVDDIDLEGSAVPLTKVQICNVALGRIGIRRPIASLNDGSDAAAQCDLYYDHALETALCEGPWSFATVRQALVLLSDATYGEPPDEWEYHYAPPTDMLQAEFIEDGLATRNSEDRIPFELESVAPTAGGDEIKRLLTNQEDAVLVYTKLQDDVTVMSPKFRDHLAWRLAAELAMPMAVSSKLRAEAERMKHLSLQRALAADFTSQQESPEPDSSFITARN